MAVDAVLPLSREILDGVHSNPRKKREPSPPSVIRIRDACPKILVRSPLCSRRKHASAWPPVKSSAEHELCVDSCSNKHECRQHKIYDRKATSSGHTCPQRKIYFANEQPTTDPGKGQR